MKSHAAWLLVLAITVAGAALRFFELGKKPLWYDEIASVARAEGRFGFEQRKDGALGPFVPVFVGERGPVESVIDESREFLPPLYFLSLRAALAAQPGVDPLRAPALVRAPTAIASSLAVLAGAATASALGGPGAAVVAAIFLAAAPFEVEYAQEARPYAFVSLSAALACLALARLLAGGGRWWWVAYVAAIVFGGSSHYPAVLVPFAHLVWWLAARRPKALAWLPIALGLGALLCASLTVDPFLHQLRDPAAASSISWTSGSTGANAGAFAAERSAVPRRLAHFIVHFLFGSYLPRDVGGPALGAGVAAFGLVLALAVLAVRASPAASMLALVALVGPALPLGRDLVLGGIALTTPRYAIMSSVALWTLAAIGLTRVADRRVMALAFSLLFGCSLAGDIAVVRATTKGPDFQGCAAIMNEAGCDERDLVIGLLQWRWGVIELNQFLAGRPSELLIEQQCDSAAFDRPWRSVFVVVAAERARFDYVGQIAAQLGPRYRREEIGPARGFVLARFLRVEEK